MLTMLSRSTAFPERCVLLTHREGRCRSPYAVLYFAKLLGDFALQIGISFGALSAMAT